MNRTLRRSLAALAFLAAATTASGPSAAAAQTDAAGSSYVVIVNSANPVDTLTRDQISRIFLKKTTRWQSGHETMPVDLAGRADVRMTFSKAVHQKSAVAINSYWQQQIFAGKDVPPPAMRSERDVVEFVRNTPDAIGYVSANTELGRSIKIVTVQN